MEDLTTPALLDAVRAWVEIESPTQDAAAVNGVADFAEGRLRALGAAIERTPGRDGFGDILVGRLPGETDAPGLLLLGHMDTVHPLGTLAGPLPFGVEGDHAYGPGIYDMKGGNAIALCALAHLHAQGQRPRRPVTVMFIPDEEAGSPTSRAAIEAEARRHHAALVFEPSGEGGKLTVARHGIARWHLTVHGVPAHAGATHAQGRSAVREMARLILAIEDMTDHARNLCVNVGVVRGGTHENIVPLRCDAIVYALVPTPAIEAELAERLHALRVHDPHTRLEWRAGYGRPAYAKTPGIQALYDQATALARDMGVTIAGERVAGGGSDGNFTGALGVPTLDGLGVIGANPHSHEEHLLLSCLAPRTRWLAALLRRL
jgi:glutamate carboxypeptidase